MAEECSTSSRFEHRLGSTASFTRSCAPTHQQDEDDIQITLAPYIQAYLAQTGRRISCCGIGLPVPFERAAQRLWWDPRFDSEILEGQYRTSSFPQVQLRFQYALIYILVVSLTWFVYFVTTGLQGTTEHWGPISGTFAFLFISTVLFLSLTFSDMYRQYTLQISLSVAVLISVLSLLFIASNPSNSKHDISPVGHFSIAIKILLVIYTIIPLPLYLCVAIGGIYSILFEFLTFQLTTFDENSIHQYDNFVRALLHISVHLIGIHILIMTNVRMRGTFMKVGQSLLVRRQLEMEKLLKEKMILSVMPPKVAKWLIDEGGGQENQDTMRGHDFRSLFRPFNMIRMDNVSILFADIVGFTRMSSNKSAEELVGILNDLFERFDDLCVLNGCEKISTLGDCYYCVSGCPEPKADHAKCCVEMGLGMIEAIQQFDSERSEGVTMRVGVHTGTVLCGLVGTRRFKFDVWSNDVTLANQMESTGEPGRVHVSEVTRQFLGDCYDLEEGDRFHDIKTYFIKGRKSGGTPTESEKVELRAKHNWSSQTALGSPATSPLVTPVQRPRVSSFNLSQKPKRSHYLQLLSSPPANQVKASSMPSILDSDNEVDSGEQGGGRSLRDETTSPRCTTSCEKIRTHTKATTVWSYPGRFQRPAAEEAAPLDFKSLSQLTTNLKRPLRGSRKDTTSTSVMSQLNLPVTNEDRNSVCRSTNSRKDSGIRSNSRRSSIQQQIFVMNGIAQGELLANRVSGYYTSSQSSFDDHLEDPDIRRTHLPPPLGDNFGACFQKLRKQSDLQLIRCVQDNVTSHRSYFVKPPLSDVSLFFRQREMEREYRTHAHRVNEKHGSSPPTLATSRFNTYLDVLISALVYSAIATSLFLLYGVTVRWITVYVLATMIQVFALFLCLRQLFQSKRSTRTHKDLSRRILDWFSNWYPWHICGAVLVSLPVVSVLVNFSCLRIVAVTANYYYSYLMFVGLVHFCNFTQLNCWMKSIMASIAGISYVVLVASQTCNFVPLSMSNISTTSPYINTSVPLLGLNLDSPSFDNNTNISMAIPMQIVKQITDGTFHMEDMSYLNNSESSINLSLFDNETIITNMNATLFAPVLNAFVYKTEIFVNVLLLLILVWFLNREFEISYRLSFHSNFVAARDKARVQSMKNQADWLLHNIIPKHVADQLKNTAKYSENHRDAGIIFASIVNFNEMYDESYLGGKEYLRVLNELIGDFDELLTKPEFSSVEKIKTIGSTFMAASGLNPEVRRQSRHPNHHLYELMNFAIALQKVIDDFNHDLLEFTLVLRIGFNYGDVTAGVIGTSKLYYDIWGDAVNIASRMDSTGVSGRIQVGGACIKVLSEWFDFEPRGSVYVKGKDNMNVFLLKGKREEMLGIG